MLIVFLIPFYIIFTNLLFNKMFFSLIGICSFIYATFYSVCCLLFDCDVALGFCEKFGKSIRILKGKVVFITGASSGIGEGLAYALARFGVKLVLAARRREELERVKAECLTKSQGLLTAQDILVLPMDVLHVELHQNYFDEALRHFGRVDILVNNAGRSQRAFWENIDLKVDKQMFDLNVFAVVSFSRVAVKYFLERNEGGHVAVTSSLAGVVGVPFSGSYTGAKHAIHGYFNSLRSEKLSNKLTVTLMCPGPTVSNFLTHCFTDIPGQAYGKDVMPNDKRLTAERCGYLCAVALANKLDECWMALFPLIPFTYFAVYWPNVYKFILKTIGPEKLFKFRDNKDPTDINVSNI